MVDPFLGIGVNRFANHQGLQQARQVFCSSSSVCPPTKRASKCLAALAKERFAAREAAESVWNERMKGIAPTYHSPTHEIDESEKTVKRNHRGRPAKDEEPYGRRSSP